MVSKKDIRFRIYPKKITAYKQIYLTIKMTLNTYFTRSADQLRNLPTHSQNLQNSQNAPTSTWSGMTWNVGRSHDF